MAQEIIIWTALPNGKNGSKLRLSAHVSFRVTGSGPTDQVQHFPTLVNWDPTKLQFSVYIDGRLVPCTVVTPPELQPVPGLFQKYFPASAPVKSADYVPQKNIPVQTFHAEGVGKYLTEVHTWSVTSGFEAAPKVSDLMSHALISHAMMNPKAASNTANRMAVTSTSTNKRPTSSKTQMVKDRLPGDSRFTTIATARAANTFPTDTGAQLVEAHMFFERNPATIPATFVPQKPVIDFHQAFSTLGTHSDLMRWVGVVFDLEIDAASVPAAGAITLHVGGMPASDLAKVTFPHTAFVNGADFRTAPRPFTGSTSDVVDAFMDMSDDKVALGSIDVNGGLFSITAFANTVSLQFEEMSALAAMMTSTTPQRIAMMSVVIPEEDINPTPAVIDKPDPSEAPPANRTVGLSLYRVNRAARLIEMRAVSDEHFAMLMAMPTNKLAGVVGSPAGISTPGKGAVAGNVAGKEAAAHTGSEIVKAGTTREVAGVGATMAPDTAPTFYADDLLKGWRPDIQFRGKWHSLMRRLNSHRIGSDPKIYTSKDEGVLSSGVTKDSATDVTQKLHESIFTWDGWSMIARRPGYALQDDGTVDRNFPQTPDAFALWSVNQSNLDANYKNASFAIPEPASLPLLRYGVNYSIRARAVDLAGNSVPLATEHRDAAGQKTSQSSLFLRHEPISSPGLHATQSQTERGDSHAVIVIRKHASGREATAASTRWIVPPAGSVALAELHGMLDNALGNPDPGKWQMLADFDDPVKHPSFPPFVPLGKNPTLPYIPDPAATGATIHCSSGYVLPICKTEFYGSASWPNPACQNLIVAAATSAPTAEVQNGAIKVSLLPGQQVTLSLTSHTTEAFLPQFNQTWALEQTLQKEQQSMIPVFQTSHPKVASMLQNHVAHRPFKAAYSAPQKLIGSNRMARRGVPASVFSSTAALVQAYMDGLNTALSPGKDVRTIYATQVPEPGFDVSVTAHRLDHDTNARTVTTGKVHGWSTGEIELDAEYQDDYDDIAEEIRTTTSVVHRHRVFTLAVPYQELEAINALRRIDSEEFHDTKCHFVKYTAILKSRYAGYFPDPDPKNPNTRTSDTYPVKTRQPNGLVIVPSSRKPDALAVEYIMPVFDWGAESTSTAKYSARRGMMVRVYLRRPWFTTGNGEQLGVVIGNNLDDTPAAQLLSHYCTVWGADPAFTEFGLGGRPTSDAFPNNAGVHTSLPLSEVPGANVDVVTFNPLFDEDRQMWYADIEVRPAQRNYMPFLRLSLCRFQQNSISQDYQIGSVSVCDITQLQPDRMATVETQVPRQRVKVTLTGVPGTSMIGQNLVLGTLEEKAGPDPDAGWVSALSPTGPIQRMVPFVDGTPSMPTIKIYQGVRGYTEVPKTQAESMPDKSVGQDKSMTEIFAEIAEESGPGVFILPDPNKSYRVVLREYELHPSVEGFPGRLVHVDAVVIQ